MIQRIQTLFLFIAFVASVCLFFFPLAGIYSATVAYKFYIYELRNMVPDEVSAFSFMTVLPLFLLNILAGALSLISIFLYKNRVRQMKLVRLAIFLDVIMIALIFFIYGQIIERSLGVSPNYLDEIGVYFPLIMLVFLLLANRFIIKDERLVRSADRLR
ncbi:MAG: DUF4293 domain-containing protein [Bacteroidales bacterium]|nr:DUF4293 domain-containing protein [Bacteroidales bacterium]